MSKHERHDQDFYETPAWAIDALLRNHALRGSRVLEPCAGDGAILKVLYSRGYPGLSTVAVEIRKEEEDSLACLADIVHIADFLTWKPSCAFDTIITNPPYSIAQEIIEHAFEIADGKSEVIMLLRLGFLEAEKRYEFWQRHPVNHLYVLSARPSFTGGGTDGTAYGWFVWDNSDHQSIKVIDSPLRPIKRPVVAQGRLIS